MELDRRAVTITFSIDPKGDFKTIPPPTPLPAVPPPTPKQLVVFGKKQDKFDKNAKEKQTLLTTIQGKIQTVLNAAEETLSLRDPLAVSVISTFHSSDDAQRHATFSFKTATGQCAIGRGCVGHAYEVLTPGQLPGRIFADIPVQAERLVFGVRSLLIISTRVLRLLILSL